MFYLCLKFKTAFKVNRSVKEAKKDLLETLWGLEEGGQTALGMIIII